MKPQKEKRISVIAAAITDRKKSGREVNDLLSQYGEYLIGRMGLNKVTEDLSVVTVVVEADTDVIGALTGKLGRLENVKVISTCIK